MYGSKRLKGKGSAEGRIVPPFFENVNLFNRILRENPFTKVSSYNN